MISHSDRKGEKIVMDQENHDNGSAVLRWLGRMAITVVALAVVSFLTPGFSVQGLWSYIIAAIVISVLDYFVEKMMKVDAKPFGKGLKGFLIAAVILYVAQFFVPNMSVSILGAIIGALVIGVVDLIIPARVM